MISGARSQNGLFRRSQVVDPIRTFNFFLTDVGVRETRINCPAFANSPRLCQPGTEWSISILRLTRGAVI